MEFVFFFLVVAIIIGVSAKRTGTQPQPQNPYNLQHEISREAETSRRLMRERQLEKQRFPEEVSPEVEHQRAIGHKIDQIAAQPGGLLAFDEDGDGVVDDEEMRRAREKISAELEGDEGDDDPFDHNESW